MDLLEDLTEIESLEFRTFLKDNGVTMLDKSADPIDKLKQLTGLRHVSCQHAHIMDHIIQKLEVKVLSVAYIPKHKHLFAFDNWPISGELVSAVSEARVGKLSTSLREVCKQQQQQQQQQ